MSTSPQPGPAATDTCAYCGLAAAHATKPAPVASAVESPTTRMRTGRGGTASCVVVVTGGSVVDGSAASTVDGTASPAPAVTDVTVVVAGLSGTNGSTGPESIAACSAAAESTP